GTAASRIGGNGAILDNPPITVHTQSGSKTDFEQSVAFAGANYLVAWRANASGNVQTIYGARVTPGGAVVDATPITIATIDQYGQLLSAGTDGTNYDVAWLSTTSQALFTARLTTGRA